MWEKCVSCGEGLFAGDAFCGNCGRPATPAVSAARPPASGQFERSDSGPVPTTPVMAAEPGGPPELGGRPHLGGRPQPDGAALLDSPPQPDGAALLDDPPPLDGPALPDDPPPLDGPAQLDSAPQLDGATQFDSPPQLELGLGLASARGGLTGPVTAADSRARPGSLAPAASRPAPVPANGQLTPAVDAVSQPEPGGRLDPAANVGLAGPGAASARGDEVVDRPGQGAPPDEGPEAAGHAGPDGHAELGAEASRQAGADGSRQAGADGAGAAGPTGAAGRPDAVDGPGDAAAAGSGPPEPELLIIPARQVGGPAGPGGRLTVPAQRHGQRSQASQHSQPDLQAGLSGLAGRVPHRTRLTGQANLDPVANSRFLLRVLRQAALFAGIYALIETVLLIVFLGLGFTGLGLHSALHFETESLWLAALALACLFWIIPVPALLGQWSMLVESSADASSSAFEHIATAFREHDVPLDSLEVRAVAPPQESGRDYLELRRGRFSGFVSCFPHGRDLYVGWTFFLRMSPARLVLVSTGRSAAHLTRRGGDIRRALWFESTRALVAAMHSATLAGIGAVVSAPDAPGETASAADDVVVRFG
jgi:hypothetical protein